MSPTHQLNHWPSHDVCAWQFNQGTEIPASFSRAGRQLQHFTGPLVNQGEWIVTDGEICFVLTAREFWRCFIEIHELSHAKNP